ncbi:MAG: SH3 domain-containing protein [Crocosphaera sp.]|nr:SH3 domain-containing protein [Crocosphaera sp.]
MKKIWKFLLKTPKWISVPTIMTLFVIPILTSSSPPWLMALAQQVWKSNIKCETTVSEKNIPNSNDKEELNIREGPGLEYNKLDTSLKNGTKIIVNKYVDGWVEISEPEKGFVAENRTKARIDCAKLYQ